MLREIQQGLNLKGIEFSVSDDLVAKITKIGYDPVWGGRSLRRVIQEKVENSVARSLLSRQIKRGDKIAIDFCTWQVIIVGASSDLPV